VPKRSKDAILVKIKSKLSKHAGQVPHEVFYLTRTPVFVFEAGIKNPAIMGILRKKVLYWAEIYYII